MYTADLVTLRKTYYDAGRQSHDEPMPLTDAPDVAAAFDGERVAATVKAIQRQEIGYAEFLRCINGRRLLLTTKFSSKVGKAMYFGRNGDSYTEPFPIKAS